MDGQLTIFDLMTEEEEKPKQIGAECKGCEYKVWLHKDGDVQSCDRNGGHGGCVYTPEHICDNCTYYRTVVSGLGDIYEHKACLVDRPFSKTPDPKDTCDKWADKTKVPY